MTLATFSSKNIYKKSPSVILSNATRKQVEKDLEEAIDCCRVEDTDRRFIENKFHERSAAWVKSAEAGLGAGEYFVGRCVECSRTRGKWEVAAYWYRRASKNGVNLATTASAHLYRENRLSNSWDYAQRAAFNLYRYSATRRAFRNWQSQDRANDNVSAHHWLGHCFYESYWTKDAGFPYRSDWARAEECFRTAAEAGHIQAQYRLSLILTENEDSEESFQWCHRAAEQGHADAQYEVGKRCSKGKGTKINRRRAFHWWKNAAEQNHVEAQIELGHCYDNGVGTKGNVAKAMQWWLLAAENGSARAQYFLGVGYRSGSFGRRNKKEAFAWFEKAASKGDSDAQIAYADMLMVGEVGKRRQRKKAFTWYKKAARKGSLDAMGTVAGCYFDGNGVKQNLSQALYWFRRAANAGDVDLMLFLGEVYEDGLNGIKPDLRKALHWYKKNYAETGDSGIYVTVVAETLASDYLAKGKTDEALELYRELEEDGHDVASDIHEIKRQIASKHADNGEYSEAIEIYRQLNKDGHDVSDTEIWMYVDKLISLLDEKK